MKKLSVLAAILCAAAVFFAGCGSRESEASQSSDTQPDSAVAVQAQPYTAALVHPVAPTWFDDAVFVGDSVTLKLSYYADSHPEALGKAQFFCAGSLSYNNSQWDLNDPNAVHPFYQGQTQLTEHCAELTGAKKVFIMLGINDIGMYGPDEAMSACEELLAKIKKNSPDVTFYIQSVTPIVKGKEVGDVNNANVAALNTLLKNYCSENGIKYLDVHSVLSDENGYLPVEYCGDADAMGIHFNDLSCGIWVDYLKNNV